MRYIIVFLVIGVLANGLPRTASATELCGVENRVVLQCPILNKDKQLTICLKDGLPDPTIAYQYDSINNIGIFTKNDFYLERDIRDVHYGMSGGKGPNLWSSVSFENGAYLYHVDMDYINFVEENQTYLAEITAFKGNSVVARQKCHNGLVHIDAWGIVWDQLRAMGYKWCGGYGSYSFDEMRYIDCITGKDDKDQVTGKPAEPGKEHPALQEILNGTYREE